MLSCLALRACVICSTHINFVYSRLRCWCCVITGLQLPQSVGPEWSLDAPSLQHIVTLSRGVKLLERETYLSPPSVMEVNNASSYTFISPYFFMAWCLNSGSNFTCNSTFAFPAFLSRRIFGDVVKLYTGYSASNTQRSLLGAITFHALHHVSQQLY